MKYLGKIALTLWTVALSFVPFIVWWNVSHNQISQDCNNIFYYNANRGACASFRLHDGTMTGVLTTPMILLFFAAMFFSIGWFVEKVG